MPAQRLKNYLDQEGVKYLTISHSMAFTALEIAKSSHIPSKEMAKTLVLEIQGQPAITVIPAVEKFDLNILKQAFETEDVALTGEQKFAKLFPDCEVGAMPPFGNLYGMETYVAESLSGQEYIAFNAGSHSEVIKMRYRDYENLVTPRFIILAA
ncbi:MAG: aminoacyl-tRNA deacylase [Gammaproteobacteria bacterium]